MIFTKPVAIALIVSHSVLALGVLHYKVRYNAAESRVASQIAETTRWKQSTLNVTDALDKQNRALVDMKRDQDLKDAQSALELAKAQREADDARDRAKGIAARQKPANVPACTAATNLFDEVIHGSK